MEGGSASLLPFRYLISLVEGVGLPRRKLFLNASPPFGLNVDTVAIEYRVIAKLPHEVRIYLGVNLLANNTLGPTSRLHQRNDIFWILS